MVSLPEWMPEKYLLQIRHSHCRTCNTDETSSVLWLISRHYLNKDVTQRKEAYYIDARLARGTSVRNIVTGVCANCFEPYEPVYQPRKEDLIELHPGKPVLGNNFKGLSLDDL